METPIAVAGILGIAAILSVSIYVYTRLRIEQERTVQKLIDKGVSADALYRTAGLAARGNRDLRRGLLLAGLGIAWSAVTVNIGGSAWMMGGVPMVIGSVFVVFWLLDGRPR